MAIDMALHRRLMSEEQLASYVARNLRAKWAGRLRRAAALAEPKSESAMESCLRVLLVKSGLPRPEAQVEIRDAHGNHLGRVDLYYPSSGSPSSTTAAPTRTAWLPTTAVRTRWFKPG